MSAPRVFVLCLLGALVLTGPLAAGTVYVPLVAPDASPGRAYQTRIWLTNQGAQAASARVVHIPAFTDGTRERTQPRNHRVPGGGTVVLLPTAGPGLLEIQAPDRVAIAAELRNTSLPGPREIYGTVPVVWSGNVARPGQGLVIQGLRRTDVGVLSHLSLLNLGHEPASCKAQVFQPDGNRVVSATDLPMPALSHAIFQDLLGALDLVRAGDVNARISCDQPFYAFVAMEERPPGEVVFLRPSPTGASTLVPPGGEPGDDGTGAAAKVVFTRSGVFHTPSKQKPTAIFNIAVPKGRSYRKIVLEMDLTPGAWSREPTKAHNLFWLHRGGCCWPPWQENIVGFANAHGPGKRQVRVEHGLDYVPPSKHELDRRAFAGGYELQRGKTYHLRYEYDAGAGRVRLELRTGGRTVMERSDKATARGAGIRTPGDGRFMAYFGHRDATGTGHGPERPTYGWKYANLRVEFVP